MHRYHPQKISTELASDTVCYLQHSNIWLPLLINQASDSTNIITKKSSNALIINYSKFTVSPESISQNNISSGKYSFYEWIDWFLSSSSTRTHALQKFKDHHKDSSQHISNSLIRKLHLIWHVKVQRCDQFIVHFVNTQVEFKYSPGHLLCN